VPLSCSTPTAPACGHWSFESGFENASVEKSRGVDTALAVSTLHARIGQQSLAVTFAGVGGPNGATIHVKVPMCPAGQRTAFNNPTLSASIWVDPEPGTSGTELEVSLYTDDLNSPADSRRLRDGAWVLLNGPIESAGASIIDVILYGPTDHTSSGVLYLDDLRIVN